MNDSVKAPLVGAWALAILAAFTSGAENGLMVSIGYGGQWVKSVKNVPTWATQAVIIAACIGVFALFHHPDAMPPSDDWVKAAAVWSLAVVGVGSLAASTGGAAKTDSN